MVWQNEILVSPDDLIAFAWSAPMRDLANELHLSDVGLKKLLARCGVLPPPQGYWNKLRAGKAVPVRPTAPPRRPGGIGRLSIDARFRKVLLPTAPLSSEGPFASALVPESLEELHEQELRAIGSARVPKTLERPHKGLLQLLKKDQRRREKAAQTTWFSEQPKFESSLDRRRIRILNAIFLTLAGRGHDGDAYEHDEDVHARAIVGDTYLGLAIAIAGKHRTVRQYGYLRAAPDLPTSTQLVLRLDPGFDGKATVSWQDDDSGVLEAKIAQIVAGIVVEGEKKFRRSLREAEERVRLEQIEKDKQRQERLAQLNQKRLQELRLSGELLRQAQDIRALICQVRNAIEAGAIEIEESMLQSWQQWALAEADRVDPVLSGQIFTHLHEPSP